MEPQLTCPEGVVYDDDAHTYRLDGELVPSVSKLLKVVDPDQYAAIAEDVLARAAARGHRRHSMVALDVRDQLDIGSLEDGDETAAYLAWLEFADAYSFAATHSERVVCSRRHKVCGTLDLAGTLVYKGSRDFWIVDLKFTAAEPALVDIQTEGYKMLAEESIGGPFDSNTRRGCLWITQGRQRFFELKRKTDRAVFMAARTIINRREA